MHYTNCAWFSSLPGTKAFDAMSAFVLVNEVLVVSFNSLSQVCLPGSKSSSNPDRISLGEGLCTSSLLCNGRISLGCVCWSLFGEQYSQGGFCKTFAGTLYFLARVINICNTFSHRIVTEAS